MPEKFKIPEELQFIINNLESNSYSAYLVGGCVRDTLLSKTPKDWDITTNATPSQIKKLFNNTIDTGLKHGTVTVIINNNKFEVTTFRIDGEYGDNRRPDNVQFTSNIYEDLKRRDFTINAIAYNPKTGLIDPCNGKEDIQKAALRTVGDADKRFNEDALRMLRAIRFSAQLNFEIERTTLYSIKNNSKLITNISLERIRDEISKIIVSENPFKFRLLNDTNLIEHIMDEFKPCFYTEQVNPHHRYDVATHILHSVDNIENSISLRWVMLLHDIGKAYTKTTDTRGIDHFHGHNIVSERIARKVLKRFKFDNKTIEYVSKLIKFHDMRTKPDIKQVRRAVNIIGKDIYNDFLKVQEADAKAQSNKFIEEKITRIEKIKNIFNFIKEQRQCTSLNQLEVNGYDLINIGFKPGKDMKIVLNLLLDRVLDDPELNVKGKLLKLAVDLKKQKE